MQISDEELRKNVAKMERGIPVNRDGCVLCVVTLKSGEETTNYFSLEELESLLTKRGADVCNVADCNEPAVMAGLCEKHSF